MSPEASPTTTKSSPVLGPIEKPIGSLPPVGSLHAVAGEMHHDFGAKSTNSSMSLVVLRPFQRSAVDSRPIPTFTRPSPSGKIQP